MTSPCADSGPLHASCHCGAIGFSVPSAPTKLTECNCSICGRLGVLWAYYEVKDIVWERGEGTTVPYVWGDRCIEFHHCPICGVTTHYGGVLAEGAPVDPSSRFAVNARNLALTAPVTVRRFDGRSSWTTLAHDRQWPWPDQPDAPDGP